MIRLPVFSACASLPARIANGQIPEEVVVKCFALVLALCGATTFVVPFAQGQVVPEITFDSVPDFLKLPPNIYLGETAGVAVNAK